jgi:hypothetical protein
VKPSNGEKKMKALSKLGATIRNWIFKRIENEKKRQKNAEQASTLMKELQQQHQLQQAKDEVDAYHARLDDTIGRAEAETTARQRVKRE